MLCRFAPQPPARPCTCAGDILRVLQARDYYQVLQVERGADADALKKAKRAMSLATHPDKNRNTPGATEAFRRVNQVSGCRALHRTRVW